ncbi:MAG: hypothetical protein M5U34_14645 [Chloroflexi bacterium]|nr:hypothetical protein [Chloroflexota bacterium]
MAQEVAAYTGLKTVVGLAPCTAVIMMYGCVMKTAVCNKHAGMKLNHPSTLLKQEIAHYKEKFALPPLL